MRAMSIKYVETDKDTHFTGSIAMNAGENEDIAVPLHMKEAAIVSVQLICTQNLDFEIWFSKDSVATAFGNADVDLDGFLGRISFAVADGKQSSDTPAHYYYDKELSAPIIVRDDTTTTDKLTLHMRLVNRNATAKSATPTTYVKVRLGLDTGVR